MNNKILLIILLALVLIFLATRMCNTKQDRSYDPNIVEVDTSQVTKIILNNKADGFEDIVFEKNGGQWTAKKGNLIVEVPTSNVSGLLTGITDIDALRIAAKKKEKWKDYEVEEGGGNRVRAFAGEKVLTDFIVGRFSFNQQTKSATSFLRKSIEDAVYAVDGFLAMTYGQGFNSYRDGTVSSFNATGITRIDIKDAESDLSIIKSEGGWQTGDGVALDSLKTMDYISGLSNLTSKDFVDDFNLTTMQDARIISVTLEGNNMVAPVQLNVYTQDDEANPYLIHSSQNEDVLFAVKEEGILQKIRTTIDQLL